MKKLFLTTLCLINLIAPLHASSSFTSFASGVKSILFAVGRGIKHFYFPNYYAEDPFSSNESVVSAPSLYEDPESAKYLKYWASKDLSDKNCYWNKRAIRLWAQTAYTQGERPRYEESVKNLEEETKLLSDSDVENEEVIT